ncbi:hypothetical protein F4808DRAFT_473655, partial [Astrocystis sublimbata]
SSGYSLKKQPTSPANGERGHPGRGDDEQDNDYVRFLEGLADRRYASSYSMSKHIKAHSHISFNAGSLVKLTMRQALAVRDPTSYQVQRFIERFHEDVKLDMNALSYNEVLDLFDEWCGRIDDIFYLGLLSRKIKREHDDGPILALVPERNHSYLNGWFTVKSWAEIHIVVDPHFRNRRLTGAIAAITSG